MMEYPRAQISPNLSDRHNRAGFRTDDLDFGLRHGPADR